MRSTRTRLSNSLTPSCERSAPSAARPRHSCDGSSSTLGVLVSAIITPAGPPAEIVREVRRGRLALVVSPHLLAELLGVLRRERFRQYVTVEEVERYVSGLASRGEMLADPVGVATVTRDPSDDYPVALARDARADAIVSGDA